MKILHTIASLDPTGGGPSRTVPSLCEHLRNCRTDWQIDITTDQNQIANQLGTNGERLLHDHGQWLPFNHVSANAARRLGVPRIVSPRGMLSPWARNHRKWKKRIAWLLYAKRDLQQAALIHATSELELRELRDLGVKQPIAVIPNGVEPLPLMSNNVPLPEKPYVLFLSRIHQKKGVAELLQVWQELMPKGWELVFAGPDEQGILERSALPPGVRYVGMVDGEPKARLMRQASLFVLPTYSENFGVVVAESLMAGVPVITTHGAPWECLETGRCGWWIPMEKSKLRDTLAYAMATPAEELRAMGARGRALVETQFAWPEIARQMAEVYEWVLGGGTRPDCVVLS